MLLLLLACIGNHCDEVEALPSASVAAIGDSILAWNASKCQSIPDHASIVLGERIDNFAVNGTELRGSIPVQLPADSDADLVMITAGGNDLNRSDACEGALQPELDLLIDEPAEQGAMPSLVEDLTAEGREVLLLGYYGPRRSAWYGLGECGDEVHVLKGRYEKLAASNPMVHYLDLEDTVTIDQGEMYAFDNVHPSPRGAETLGGVVAEELESLR